MYTTNNCILNLIQKSRWIILILVISQQANARGVSDVLTQLLNKGQPIIVIVDDGHTQNHYNAPNHMKFNRNSDNEREPKDSLELIRLVPNKFNRNQNQQYETPTNFQRSLRSSGCIKKTSCQLNCETSTYGEDRNDCKEDCDDKFECNEDNDNYNDCGEDDDYCNDNNPSTKGYKD